MGIFTGCAATSGSTIPTKEFDYLAKVLADLDSKLMADAASTDNVAAIKKVDDFDPSVFNKTILEIFDKNGKHKELASFPANYVIVPVKTVTGNVIKVSDKKTGRFISQLALPNNQNYLRVRKIISNDIKGSVFKPTDEESRKSLHERVTGYMKGVYEAYRENSFIKVEGFSVKLSWTPEVVIDFKIKD